MERMNYTQFIPAFERHVTTLPFEALRKSISICERCLADSSVPVGIDRALWNMKIITPHMDDFDDWDSSYALNACTAVIETLEFLRQRSNEHILNIGISLIDTIDFRIHRSAELEGKPDPAENEIDPHPLMQEAREYLLSRHDR